MTAAPLPGRRRHRRSTGFGHPWRTAGSLAVLGAALATAASCPLQASAAPKDTTNPYFSSSFTTSVNSHTFGQDPSWTADGRVLSAEPAPSGVQQVYVSALNGSGSKCLTCGQPGPNGFPQGRPQGDWILFCSWRGQQVTLGAPCLGGVGSDLYAMRPDGSHLTRLTAPGMSFEPGTVQYDNYHPYWSPDGDQIAWTHLNFVGAGQGGTQWTMLVADFTVSPDGTPSLTDVKVVGPAGDTAYETQVWAPDGNGFLYTTLSSDGNKRDGWLNTELYYLRLYGKGASLAHPQVTHLTDYSPAWDEQAVFTPDMKDVIWMSSRASPTWFEKVVSAAQRTGFDPAQENETVGPMFFLTILDPNFHTDLYEMNLATHAIRRLTRLGNVVPEFYFSHNGRELLWSETQGPRNTIIGTFHLASAPHLLGPRVQQVAAWRGAPKSARISQPLPIKSATANPPTFHAVSLPSSITAGLAIFETQLKQLAKLSPGLPLSPP